MQLGELQHQLERFERRGVKVIALSVDEPEISLAMVQRLGIQFPIGSDPNQKVIQAFRVQNPDTRELALHAVYILNTEGEIFYRKVGLRRPLSEELIDAIDAYRGDYPRAGETVAPRQRINVAYPTNEFQALLTAASVDALPPAVEADGFNGVLALIRERRSDDATIAYRSLVRRSGSVSEQDLLSSAAWLTRTLFFFDHPDAVAAGKLLAWRLDRIDQLEQALAAAQDNEKRDEVAQNLARARAGLVMTRAEIEAQSDTWNLRYAKTTLRSYREVVLGEVRFRGS